MEQSEITEVEVYPDTTAKHQNHKIIQRLALGDMRLKIASIEVSLAILGIIFNESIAREKYAAYIGLIGILLLIAFVGIYNGKEGENGEVHGKKKVWMSGVIATLLVAVTLVTAYAIVAFTPTLSPSYTAQMSVYKLAGSLPIALVLYLFVIGPLLLLGIYMLGLLFPSMGMNEATNKIKVYGSLLFLLVISGLLLASRLLEDLALGIVQLVAGFWHYDLFKAITLAILTIIVIYELLLLAVRVILLNQGISYVKLSIRVSLFLLTITYLILAMGIITDLLAKITEFIHALEKYEFLQRAFISAIVIGILSSLVGVFILLRGMVFLGEAIAHSAFAGAALAVLLGVNPLAAILIFSIGSAVGIGYVNEKQVMKNEVVIGIVFSFFMALAVFFIGLIDVQTTDVNSILFGNILLTNKTNFGLLLFITAIILIVLFLIKNSLFFMTFDKEIAEIHGVPVRFLDYLFLIMVATTISFSLRAIGAILVFAMVVTPAAAAYQLTYKLNDLLALSAIFGVGSSVMGLFIAFVYDLPSGSTIVILVTTIFVITFIFSPKRAARAETLGEPCDDPECIARAVRHRHYMGRVYVKQKDLEKIVTELDKKHPENEQKSRLKEEEKHKDSRANGE